MAQSTLKFWSQLLKVYFQWIRDHFETTLSHRNLCFEFFERVLLTVPFTWLINIQGFVCQLSKAELSVANEPLTCSPKPPKLSFQKNMCNELLVAYHLSGCHHLAVERKVFSWLMNYLNVLPSHQSFLFKKIFHFLLVVNVLKTLAKLSKPRLFDG